MIAVISLAETLEYYDKHQSGFWDKRFLERLTGAPAVVLHVSQAAPEYIDRIKPQAVFITGFPRTYSWTTVKVPTLYGVSDFLHATDVPVYAACGGHQLIGHCFNNNLRRIKRIPDMPMRKCRPGELEYGDMERPGLYRAYGYFDVEIVRPDPIFKGLKKKFRVRENHYMEIKKLPKDFVRLAAGPECKLEMIRHKDRLIYGSQFHPEGWKEPYAAGRIILENFFRLAGVI